jgi:hypothetical protein
VPGSVGIILVTAKVPTAKSVCRMKGKEKLDFIIGVFFWVFYFQCGFRLKPPNSGENLQTLYSFDCSASEGMVYIPRRPIPSWQRPTRVPPLPLSLQKCIRMSPFGAFLAYSVKTGQSIVATRQHNPRTEALKSTCESRKLYLLISCGTILFAFDKWRVYDTKATTYAPLILLQVLRLLPREVPESLKNSARTFLLLDQRDSACALLQPV